VLSTGETMSVPEARTANRTSGTFSCAVTLNVPRSAVAQGACHDLVPSSDGREMLTHECRHTNEEVLRLHANRLLDQAELVSHVLGFLKLRPVDMARVRVVGASSSGEDDPRCSPAFTLDSAHDTWWISAHNSCPNGHGQEWVEFDLGADDVCVRLFHLTIPPLPSGPLSVRHLHLQACSEPPTPVPPADAAPVPPADAVERNWRRVSADWTTLDAPTQQTFALEPPLERTRYVRVVCTTNAAADEEWLYAPSSIGFFSCSFS